jgi:SPP1 gp7 family putative phage head morphogenesis protein
VTDTLANANEESLRLVRGEQLNEFAEGMNHEQFVLSQNTGLSINFGIYDADTVGRLIQEQPDLLPAKKLNRGKDSAWNQKKVTGSVLQGIIQGESIDDIARRIARDTAQQNSKAMIRYARTAITGAQNAGRMETMHRAHGMGINVRKQWLATLDNRTRDSHQRLDGNEADVDDPFKSEFGDIMFPGDPHADPADVYNCRCTLVYVYPDYPTDPGERLDNITREHVRGDMTYEEWAAVKQSAQAQQQEPESALESKIQKAVQAVRPKKAQYTPAASCEEAEAYAGRFLGYNGKVSYKGIELEYANKCNQVLADIHETFDVEGLHGIQAMNTREKLWKTSTSEAAYRWGSGDLFINPRYYKSPAAFKQHKDEIDSLMETVMKGGQALIDSGKVTGRKKDYIETLLRTGRQCVSQSYDFVEGTFVHECGHMMDDKIVRRELIQAFGGSNVRYGDMLAESRAKYGGKISGYAISDNQEYIAETFTAWWFGEGEKCDPVIVDVFERLVKK